VQTQCEAYVDKGAMRNHMDAEITYTTFEDGQEVKRTIKKRVRRETIRMSTKSGEELYLASQAGITRDNRRYGLEAGDFDHAAGHDFGALLTANTLLPERGEALLKIVQEILTGNPETKIIVFFDDRLEHGEQEDGDGGDEDEDGAGGESKSGAESKKKKTKKKKNATKSKGGSAREVAKAALTKGGIECTYIDSRNDSNQEVAMKIGWYQTADDTEEEKLRPRVLFLNFAHAAGLNLQAACHNVVLYTPRYTGQGGKTGDPVKDTSTELQAIVRDHSHWKSQTT